jgi:hypothetical protein
MLLIGSFSMSLKFWEVNSWSMKFFVLPMPVVQRERLFIFNYGSNKETLNCSIKDFYLK